jgi:hypothetical protein
MKPPTTFYAIIGNTLSRRALVSQWLGKQHRFHIHCIDTLKKNPDWLKKPKLFHERIVCPNITNEAEILYLHKNGFEFIMVPEYFGEYDEDTKRFYKCLDNKLTCVDHEQLHSF